MTPSVEASLPHCRLHAPIRPFDLIQVGEEAQVLNRRQIRVHVEIVSDQADEATQVVAAAGSRPFSEPNGPRGRREQRRGHEEERRLSGAVRTENGDDLAAVYAETDPIERTTAPEIERDVGEGERGKIKRQLSSAA